MTTAVQRMVNTLRSRSLGQAAATQTDRRLLEAFAETGDETAFAELVRRHGALVLGVCRRILGSVQDAEDAFQAVFLVLARKAGSVPWQNSIKNWLHDVACRIAMKARSQRARRKIKEAETAAAEPADSPAPAAWNDLRAVLDEELQKLPEKYRAVLILCYLEGKTRDEAAESLGWSGGSVKGYLERGRELLRSRLAKRGLALSAALVAGLLSDATAGAATIPAALSEATMQSVGYFLAGSHTLVSPPILSLAQGALYAMMIAKIKTMGFVATMLLFGAATLAGIHYGVADSPASAATTNPRVDAPPVHFASFVQEKDKDGREGDKKRKDGPFGLVKEIDLKVGTITISGLRDGDTGDVTFSLAAKDLKVGTTFGEPMKLSDVKVGMRVHLEVKDQDVQSLHVENPIIPAFFNSIDDKNRTVEARAERKIGTYTVSANAKITINGKAVELKDVPLNERIFLTLSIDKKTVLAMHANNRRDDGRPGVERPKDGDRPKEGERPVERAPLTNATIIDVDAAKSTINVLTGREGDPMIQTITVAKDTKVKVLFTERPVQEVTISDLKKPLPALVRMSDDGKSAAMLNVVAPTLRGVVKSVDAAAKKITIIEGREEKTYTLADTILVRTRNREADGTLADIKPNATVLIGLSLDRQRVIGIAELVVPRRDGDRE